MIGVVSLMATLGLLILWINDQLVYQRLLNAGFLIALKLEFDDCNSTSRPYDDEVFN